MCVLTAGDVKEGKKEEEDMEEGNIYFVFIQDKVKLNHMNELILEFFMHVKFKLGIFSFGVSTREHFVS